MGPATLVHCPYFFSHFQSSLESSLLWSWMVPTYSSECTCQVSSYGLPTRVVHAADRVLRFTTSLGEAESPGTETRRLPGTPTLQCGPSHGAFLPWSTPAWRHWAPHRGFSKMPGKRSRLPLASPDMSSCHCHHSLLMK